MTRSLAFAKTGEYMSPSPARAVIIIAFLICSVVFGPSLGSAHAVLLHTYPAENSQLPSPPGEVLLIFNESVQVQSLTVSDGAGGQVDLGDAASGNSSHEVRVSLPEDMPFGVYVVNWRVNSADSHPVGGSFVFMVGESAEAASDLPALAENNLPSTPNLEWLRRLHQGLLYVATLFAAGSIPYLLFVRDPRIGSDAAIRTLARYSTALAAIITVVGIAVHGSISGVGDMLATGFGTSLITRIGGLSLVWWYLAYSKQSSGLPAAGGWIGAIAAAGSFALTGHAVTASPALLRSASTFVHLLAAAAWFSGLGLLMIDLRRSEIDRGAASRLVARFSRLAAAAALAVLAAGVALTWVEVRFIGALWSTAYGNVLLLKILFVLIVLAAALYNNRSLVPRVTSADATSAPSWPRLRQAVALEVSGIVLVLVATGFLVGLTPPRNLDGGTAASWPTPFLATAQLDDYELSLRVDPAMAGDNTVELMISAADGIETAPLVERVRLRLVQPDAGIGPIRIELTPQEHNTFYYHGPVFAVSGTWHVEARLRLSQFTEKTIVFQVPIDD